jgi:predicted MFS family arabinose efflux permease
VRAGQETAGRARRRTRVTRVTVAAALAVELIDELVDGTRGAALPLIRDGLGLSYTQIGVLAGVPLIVGGLIELPVGVLAGQGRRRRRVTLAGGLVFIAALAAVAAARAFGPLLAAFVIFFPASGAFVSLTEAALMDAGPSRRVQLMARWTLAGAAGAVAGPLLLTAVVAAGGSWRTAYLALALAAAAAWLALAAFGPGRDVRPSSAPPGAAAPGSPFPSGTGRDAGPGVSLAPPGADTPDRPVSSGTGRDAGLGASLPPPGADAPDWPASSGSEEDGEPEPPWPARLRSAGAALRDRSVLRWLLLLQVADLLLDVLTGFVALYLVAAAGASPGQAAIGVAVRLAADLAGSALLIPVLERHPGRAVLRVSALAALLLFPAFLLVPGLWAKVAVLAALSLATTAWYPVLQAELYDSLPGRSGVAVSLLSAAGLAGGLGPLAVGAVATWLGLPAALTLLVLAPAVVLLGAGRRAG